MVFDAHTLKGGALPLSQCHRLCSSPSTSNVLSAAHTISLPCNECTIICLYIFTTMHINIHTFCVFCRCSDSTQWAACNSIIRGPHPRRCIQPDTHGRARAGAGSRSHPHAAVGWRGGETHVHHQHTTWAHPSRQHWHAGCCLGAWGVPAALGSQMASC